MNRLLRPFLAASLAAAAVAGATAASAQAQQPGKASKIVYACAPDLCVVDPATGVSSPLTSDGTAEVPYGDPSLSADGSRLAAQRGSDVLVGAYGGNLTERWTGSQGLNDVALSPDGAAVAESHSYVRNVNKVVCVIFAGCSLQLVLEDFSGAGWSQGVAGEGNTRGFSGGGGVGFLGNGSLLTAFYTLRGDVHSVCVIATPATPADPPCGATAQEVGATLSWPDGSPDSRLIAAAKGPGEGDGPSVVNVYDAATGAFVRQVATGTTPAFSPDGSQIAYQSADGWIEVVATAGGTPRRLVAGGMPTWSAGTGPGPRVSSTALRYARDRVTVAIRCEGQAACTGAVRIRKGRVTIGSKRYRVAAGKVARVAVKPTARGRRALGRARRVRVAVQLAPQGGKAIDAAAVVRR